MNRALRLFALLGAVAVAGWISAPRSQASVPALDSQQTPPDTIVMQGPTRGTVTFAHLEHQDRAECETCHHESREEKPLTEEQEACSGCHTPEPTAPMTTSLRDAFHDERAREGTCATCHREEDAKGTEGVPTRCSQCHVRDEGADGS